MTGRQKLADMAELGEWVAIPCTYAGGAKGRLHTF